MAASTLVTGANGFIGSYLCEALCERGYAVRAAVRRTSDRSHLAGLPITFAVVDLETGAGLAEALSGVELVFHVAGLTRAHTLAEYRRGNVLPTRRLLEAIARLRPPLRRFLYVSSLAAAGPSVPGKPARETDPPHPITNYGIAKLEAERAVLRFAGQFPVTIVRPPAVYGPRDRNMVDVFRSAAKGFSLLPNGGRGQASFIHAADLARGLVLAAECPCAAGQVYYLSGQVTTVRGMADLLERIVGRRLRRINIPPPVLRLAAELFEFKWWLTGRPQIISRRKIKDLLQPAWVVSDEKARRDFGYRPLIALADGLAQTLAWYRAHGWLR